VELASAPLAGPSVIIRSHDLRTSWSRRYHRTPARDRAHIQAVMCAHCAKVNNLFEYGDAATEEMLVVALETQLMPSHWCRDA